MGRQYSPIDPTKGGKTSAVILAIAMVGSVAILAASVFLGIKLANSAGEEPPPPPVPPPKPPVNVTITSLVQMALLFLEAQKSGALPPDYPITWRNNSGLLDGQDQNRNLSGGYYIDGSNVKYHFPMAYTVTMLSWALLEYESVFRMVAMDGEMTSLIRWGVEYLLKTRFETIIFSQIGTPDIDSLCWIRPEDMKPAQRPSQFPCDITHPCSDLAAEYAAAFASASLVYRIGDPVFADRLLTEAISVFDYADSFRGRYSDWVPGQGGYNSTGYEDELMWGAAWLFFASGDEQYLDYLIGPNSYTWATNQWTDDTKVFNWDKKSPGVQVLMSRLLLLGYGIGNDGSVPQFLITYLIAAKLYVCQYTPSWTHANFTDSGDLIWQGDTNAPLQYAINAAFLGTLLTDYLRVTVTANISSQYLTCDATLDNIVEYAAGQVEYVLGKNPLNMSYMVGFRDLYPTNVHHRAASIPSPAVDPNVYTCSSGQRFLDSRDPNPNVLVGAIVGGPAQDDSYDDDRTNREQSEPHIYVNAVFAGVLAALGAPIRPGNSLTRMWVQLPWAMKYATLLQEEIPKPYPSPPTPPIPPPPWVPPPPGSEDPHVPKGPPKPPPYVNPPPPRPPPPHPPPPVPKRSKIPPPPFLRGPGLTLKRPPSRPALLSPTTKFPPGKVATQPPRAGKQVVSAAKPVVPEAKLAPPLKKVVPAVKPPLVVPKPPAAAVPGKKVAPAAGVDGESPAAAAPATKTSPGASASTASPAATKPAAATDATPAPAGKTAMAPPDATQQTGAAAAGAAAAGAAAAGAAAAGAAAAGAAAADAAGGGATAP